MGGIVDLRRAAKVGGILLISLIAMIHLFSSPEHFKHAPWIGWSFLVLVLGAGVSAVGIEQETRWGWWLGILTAGGSFVALVISRTVGLPSFGMAVGKWEPIVIYTLFVEAVFILVLFPLAPKGRDREDR